MNVFVSVATGLSPEQEAFVDAVENRLRAIGLVPCTIGRNTFSTEAPLQAVVHLMRRCAGTVVIALERYRFDAGLERPGSAKEKPLGPVRFPTAWNQIEAAMAYSRHLPLLVLVDESLRCDGLLEKGNDWYVHELAIDPAELNGPAFGGLLNDWRARLVAQPEPAAAEPAAALDPAKMSVGQLIAALKPAQLWTALVTLGGALAGAFALGMKLAG
ncbi:hypothetical protein FHS95_001798 [Sphingomonas naasensis]|uniref:DUF4062 domain-containing protein n=1 Tax=Sphingomonas naasensis TaxID=1344951 RepID=A0A4S1WLX4_9SPHN|nr:hypothetical protein [Sphingomonas naasensis]NIJ20106.1 hypothetical protein [Sphingomonas naasensis]TGX44259.1 hypothetical protein E5A74_05510 [Sphingomonas naasensis]